MSKFIVIIWIFSWSNWQCKSGFSDKRMQVIQKVIGAIEKYDTNQLYKIVDTSYYFDLDEKEGFLFTINYLNDRFKECGNTIVDSTIEIKKGIVNTTEYVLPFCRNADNSLNDKSFDLYIRFADYNNNDKIMFFNIEKPFIKTDSLFSPPIKAPPNK